MPDYLPQAIEVYREAVARFPDNVVAMNGLAQALKHAGRVPEAIQINREAIARFPADRVARISLADSLSRLGLIEESIQTYKETVARFPFDPVALTGLAEALKRASTQVAISGSSPIAAIRPYRYQVALSFAGEDRLVARELAQGLTNKGVSVFFDENEQSSLWGKDLYQHFQHVYRDSAQFCVLLISKHYVEKLWTSHELKQAQARAFEETREYILPLRLDDTVIAGIATTVGYLDVRNTPIEVVVRHIIDKLASVA